MPVLNDPQRLERLKLLQANPQMSQRDLAQATGASLGKAISRRMPSESRPDMQAEIR